MKIKKHSKRKEFVATNGTVLTLQQQADSAQALLYIQELVDGGLAVVSGNINPARCHQLLAELKRQGIEPIEDRAVRLSHALGPQLGLKLTAKGDCA